MWAGFDHPGQVAWYKRQKRSSEAKGTKRCIEDISFVEQDSRESKRGRRMSNLLVPYGVFQRCRLAAGTSQQEIDDEWKEMLKNPDVDREEIMVNNKLETCLAYFQGIEKYHDENMAKTTRLEQRQKIERSSDLDAAMARRASVVRAAQSDMPIVAANVSRPVDPKSVDIEVPRQLVPAPLQDRFVCTDVVRSGLAVEMADAMWKHERSEAELEAEWAAEAEDWADKKKEERGNLGTRSSRVRKSVIEARSKIDTNVVVATDKLESLTKEFLSIEATCVTDDSSTVTDLKGLIVLAEAALTKLVEGLAEQKKLLEPVDVREEHVKECKLKQRELTDDFLRGEAKDVHTGIAALKKAVARRERLRVRQAKQAGEIHIDDAYKPTMPSCLALEAGRFDTLVSIDVNALNLHAEAVCCGGEACEAFHAKAKEDSYLVNQFRYLKTYMDKEQKSIQSVFIGLRSIVKELREAVQADGIERVIDCPEKAMKGKRMGWGGVFQISLTRARHHQFVGLSNMAVGECMWPLRGKISVAGGRMDKLPGTLAEQVAAWKAMSGEQLRDAADFLWTWSEADTESQILAIPPGMIYSMVSTEVEMLHWGYGCVQEADVVKTMACVQSLIKSWPSLNEGDYVQFIDFLQGAKPH